MKTILKSIFSIFCLFLLSVMTLVAQDSFEGVIKMDTYNGELEETATITWYVKGDMHKMNFNSTVKDTSYDYALLMSKGSTKMLTETRGEKLVYDLPMENFGKKDDMSGVKLMATGEAKEIAGYNSEKYTAEFNGKKMIVWIAGDFPLHSKSLSPVLASKGVLGVMKHQGIEGLPFEYSVTDENGNVVSSQQVTLVSEKDLSASEFDVPADYKKFGE